MSYSIVYSSRTGNTALLAQAIREALPQEECSYFGAPHAEALAADTIYVGFWTDKGTCDEQTAHFLQSLLHALPDFLRRHTEIFRAESHIFFHNSRYKLVIGILKYHAHLLPDFPYRTLIRRVHAIYQQFAFRRQQKSIQMTRQRRFTAPVRPDNRRKPALSDLCRNIF